MRALILFLLASFICSAPSWASEPLLNASLAPLRIQESEQGLLLEIAFAADKLSLEQKGQVIETREQPQALERFDPSQLSGSYIFRLWRADKEIASINWTARHSTVPPKLHLPANQVVGQQLNHLMISSNPGHLRLEIDGKTVYQTEVQKTQTLQIPGLTITPGRHHLQAILDQRGKLQTSSKVQFFNLGVEPLDHSYLVADKYSFSLYWIRKGVLHRIYPVATGRPGLPTQPGFWLIGNKDTMFAASDWGSFRLRIYREDQYRHHWSGYAVHGTNKPNSIGTEASHGCLRMFNQDVTELHAGIEIGTPLLIVEKLPVYIENI